MFEKFSGYTPLISLLSVTCLAVFNIGYFWPVGLHFLGTTDLSNLVYSLGLALAFVYVGGIAAYYWAPALTGKITPIEGLRLFRRTNYAYVVGGLLVFVFGILKDALGLSGLLPNGLVFLGLLIGAAGALSRLIVNYKRGMELHSKDIFIFILTAVGCVFQSGYCAALVEMNDRHTYDFVTTREQLITGARIVRSSSSGFILYTDKKVMFIPQSQVWRIQSSANVQN